MRGRLCDDPVNAALLFSLLFLLASLTAPQQLSRPQNDVSRPINLAGASPSLESPHPPRYLPPVKNADDASALATLALAGSGRAVRAPPAQANPSAGLVPQLQARSLQDWEVEDFVLLATVDGTIHARD